MKGANAVKGIKALTVAMSVIAPLALIAGCGSSGSTNTGNGSGGNSSKDKITIRFANWVSAETATKANVDKVIQAFEKLHPNVTVQNVAIPFDNMYQQLTTMAAGGNLPDVVMLSGPWTQELGAAGDLSDLTPLAGQQYLGDNFQGALEAGEYNSKLYSIPSELTPHAFWYNKDLMKKAGLDPNKPPQTLDELNKDMAIIKSKLGSQGVYPIGIDTTKIDYALVEFFPYFYEFNAKPLYNDKGNFNTPEVTQALTWLRTSVQKGYTPVGQQIKDERDLMAKDKIVFKLDGPYLKGILASLNSNLSGQNFYDTFGVAPVPVGANESSQTLADLHQLGISAQSKTQQMDWEFIKYFASSEESIKDYEIPVGAIPPLKSYDQQHSSDMFADPVSQAYINKILPTMIAGPYGPKYAQSSQVVIQALQETALTNQPISQIQQQTEQQLDSIYGQ
jgi:multiple sugar transport system substrate-binding protein